jgi:pilus assembly protein Flp/PilA
MTLGIWRKKRQAGQGMVEFALILVLVAVVVIATMMVMGNTVQNNFWNILSSFDTSGQTPQQISCHAAHYNCGAGP